MRKAILMLLLAVVSSSAAAGWVEVTSNTDKTTMMYADPSTIRKAGDKAKMWVLHDYQTVQGDVGNQYMSVTAQVEFDCKEEQTRTLYVITRPENMGMGAQVSSFKVHDRDWNPVAPRSAIEALLQFACVKQ